MTMSQADAELLRLADDEAERDRPQSVRISPPAGTVCLGATKTLTTYPTAVGQMFAITPKAILGAETEGSAATLSALGGTIFAVLTSGSVPASGTDVICHRVPYRWIFEY